ncbi:MAG TPA: ribose 5-phosphate isomerase B [Feifaniaceae bacterium]|nr:ribose 5-phosphate isomerase B [Feifaniaceae bacterium]
MKIGFGSDHGGYLLKAKLIALAKELGHETVDFGTNTPDSTDYPDYASSVATAVSKGELDRGVVLCNTGIGASITANKARGVRCALCSEPLSARLTREHNDANMLALGACMIGDSMAEEIFRVWLNTPFSGGERHCRRIQKITEYEARQ